MKCIIAIILTVVIVASMGVISMAEGEKAIQVLVDGKPINFDVEPITVNDRTLVPMRAIFVTLGSDVKWDESTQIAIGEKNGIVVNIQIGSTNMKVNNKVVEMDQPAILQDGRTLVPVRAISESFDCEVSWNDAERIVSIITKKNTVSIKENQYFITANGFKDENLGTFVKEGDLTAYEDGNLKGRITNDPILSKNATVDVDITRGGIYQVWGRTKDYQTNQPGTRKLKLMVNGILLDKELGKHGTDGYKWEKAGDVLLEAGKTTVEVVDSSAFYGRMDGIFITSDKNLIPPEKFDDICEISKTIGHIDSADIKWPDEFHERGGLPNFFNKINSGKEVNVGYLGGSITQANGGYREKTYEWLKEQFDGANFNLISAGVSGTNSDLGALRVNQDIISTNCDLVFVEFACNDSGRAEKDVEENMEGIVRQVWRANPNADILFVYTLKEDNVNFVKKGEYPPTALYMEKVAEKYNIPSIFMAVDVVKKLVAGELIFTSSTPTENDKIVFSTDGIHPTIEGHMFYLEAVKRSMLKMQTNAKLQPHTIPEPLISDIFANVTMLDPRQANPSTGWKFCDTTNDGLAKAFSYMFNGFLRAENPGETLKFKFIGTGLGVYDVGGPETGQLTVLVDGEQFTLDRFTEFSFRNRPQYIFIPKIFENKEHNVEIKLSNQQADKESIMLKAKKPYSIEEFDHTVVNIGKILIVGEVIK